MAAFIKFSLSLCICICLCTVVYANKIDSLSTKEDVQKFLAAELGNNGILLIHRCTGLSQAARNRLYNHLYITIPDTMEVEDPITHEIFKKTFPRDSSGLRSLDTESSLSYHMPFMYTAEEMDKRPWDFYKADIDRNGYTDLVIDIDTYGAFVVLDVLGRFEGHKLTDSRDFISYSFKGFILLPDGSTALLLRRNPCTLVERTAHPKVISYITDTTINKSRSIPTKKIDTTYQIITIVDSIYRWKGDVPTLENVWVQSDTVDMKRYNVIDTIVYKFNAFVKYNPHFNPVGISKIVYHQLFDYNDMANNCMEVNRNGKCFLHNEEYNTTFSGMYDSAKLTDLWDLTAYLDVNSNNYSDYSNNDQIRYGNVFVVHFNNGAVKEIVFGRCTPPMGLGYLSKGLSEISQDIHWQVSEKCVGFECPCKHRPIVEWNSASCDCDSIDEVW